MDPYPPPRRVRIDTDMSIDVQHDGVVWVDEVVHPVFLVGLAPPGPGQSAGPKSIPLSIANTGRLNADVVEASALGTLTQISYIQWLTRNGNPLLWTAGGDQLSAGAAVAWVPGIPVTITADGAGAVAAAVAVQALHATKKNDALWCVQVSVSGLHQLDFVGVTGAPVATIPDYNTAPPDVYLVAGYPYYFRLMNVAVNQNLGVNSGGAGYFPNDSVMTITPLNRQV